ncbi:Z1 domain-containing protein [Aestuariimicrobium sp. T2.26MG-19.2B]|uniref:Z1 domain-containing protein n=1 Tax=Aestuariimicrobium sp. T2.26MG-19.2B TaxID=3040679 RepID=UPI002477BDAC|nr:Z1 domain-containing protein [Aestuariimicrobium sp. T2.26MG-19.2B]CAI9405062.1 hypothetical protein AESSP_01336 [Aestuariimicrobium sp. T2.26MG-19.2B]
MTDERAEKALIADRLIDLVQMFQTSLQIPLHEAALRVLELRIPGADEIMPGVVGTLQERAASHTILDVPAGVSKLRLQNEVKLAQWYTGPNDTHLRWNRLRRQMLENSPVDVVDSVDQASTKIVAQLANPHVSNLRQKGLVLGHVQSGKTANYAAVIAKAADAGYKMVIVLAGLHNNLRQQTQRRLDRDLGASSWIQMTDADHDFGLQIQKGEAILGVPQNRVLAVVKKNGSRLKRLHKWLRDIPRDVRERCPILIIDDEADQATPNSSTAIDKQTAINKILRQVWNEVLSGTYVGYTATPFANVFMSPEDEEDFYPEDFIVELPRSKEYFGAERIFGREQLDENDDPDDGLDMVRTVPVLDEESLRVSPSEKESYVPDIVPSLVDALRWFALATAVRRERGDEAPSSMLIHTTHFVDPHFAMKDAVDAWVTHEANRVGQGAMDEYECLWRLEHDKALEVATQPTPHFSALAKQLPLVLGDLRVIVDNGSSNDRLDYEVRDEAGHRLNSTVVAIGGGTLSRGLTLEGLVVSYFIRTSSTYDTLLQMARWFGYRPGYEELPRIWMTDSLQQDFRFLALVEADLRVAIHEMSKAFKTPKDVGVRVRTHPGRLSITTAAKMRHAQVLQVSYNGEREQSFILHETDRGVLEGNWNLLEETTEKLSWQPLPRGRGWISRDAQLSTVLNFIKQFELHPAQASMNVPAMVGWIRNFAADRTWNVVLPSNSQATSRVSLGSLGEIGLHRRAPLKVSPVGVANIKALLSESDWLLDLPDGTAPSKGSAKDRRHASDQVKDGMLILMPIDGRSVPKQSAGVASRRAMQAPEDMNLVGYGLVFPKLDGSTDGRDAGYVAVKPTYMAEYTDVDFDDEDDEPDMEVPA